MCHVKKRIAGTTPERNVDLSRYNTDFKQGNFLPFNYVVANVGELICVRLITDRKHRSSDKFAGDFLVRILDIGAHKRLKIWEDPIVKRLKVENGAGDITDNLYVNEAGIIWPKSLLKSFVVDEEGYIPRYSDDMDEFLGNLLLTEDPTLDPALTQ